MKGRQEKKTGREERTEREGRTIGIVLTV